MSAFSALFGKMFDRTTRKREEQSPLYPDASKAIEEFHLRLVKRIAAERARNGTSTRKLVNRPS
jgi:hypothetical protein